MEQVVSWRWTRVMALAVTTIPKVVVCGEAVNLFLASVR